MAHPNAQLIHQFYSAFQRKDPEGMKQCYHEELTFNDEVFRNLNYLEACNMWEMLIKAGKDLEVEFSDIQADDTHGQAQWTATYTFSKTQREVVNKLQASFVFKEGKIVQHTDRFNFYKWARQAFGMTGILLGWSGFFKNKVRETAKHRLLEYMKKNKR